MNLFSSSKYSDLKIFNFVPLFEKIGVGKVNPIHIRLKPTNKCNHRCSYCAYRNSNQSLGKGMNFKDEIPFKKMQELVDDFSEMGVKAITFSGGGEPLLYPRITEVFRKVFFKGIKYAVLTNGSLLKNGIAEEIAHRCSWARISIDGWDNKSYSKFRKVPNSAFTNLLENIKKFKVLNGSCVLSASIIAGQENANNIYELISKLVDCGIKDFKIAPCIVSDNTEKNENYHKSIKIIIDEQVKKANRSFDININHAFHQLCSFEKKYKWCPTIQLRPVIGADQCVYTCQDKAYTKEGMLTSFENKRFKDAWLEIDKFKLNPSVDCKHHCVADNKNKMIAEFMEVKQHLDFV